LSPLESFNHRLKQSFLLTNMPVVTTSFILYMHHVLK